MEKFIEELNRVELRGRVGSVRVNPLEDGFAVMFSMATNYVFRLKGEKYDTIEITWHNVEYFAESKEELERLERGAVVHVVGRIRMNKYINGDNKEIQVYTVRAHKIEIEQTRKSE